MVVPFMEAKADTAVEGQSTEGKDFWVTFMQGDADDSGTTDSGAKKRFKLSLSISARTNATVHIKNDYFHFDSTVIVSANTLKEVAIFDGIKTDTRIRGTQTNNYSAKAKAVGTAQYCYSFHPEMVDSCVLHVTSDTPISLYASNYKSATFDATNVLPTTALQSEYKVVCYTPSDHGGDGSSQGSHFAIVATEDSTVVEYTLTANTYNNKHRKGNTVTTDTLRAGEVWYVWTGKGASNGFGHGADLTGTTIKAYNAYTKEPKRVAVFQGNPHTNIPFYKDLPGSLTKAIGERDHIFSQAMPLSTWGNTFVLTTSQLRDRDVIRVMAQEDGTEVYMNGDLTNPIHVFDFSVDTQHYWEFEIGVDDVPNGRIAANGDFFAGESFLLQTSCPAAVHEFMVSKKYGKTQTSNGDPAMLWINPIEQQIDQITFATYSSENGTTHHYTNVVTTADNVANMMLDNTISLADSFKVVPGSTIYKYARLNLKTTAGSHTLKGDPTKGFIAHVYGCTGNESYGYNAGGATKPLTQSITINGEVFSPDKENKLCGIDTVHFACKPDYEIEQVVWHFGDGTPDVTITDTAVIVPHYYQNGGDYDATCSIYRSSSNLCKGQSAVIVIKIKVTIGRYSFSIGKANIPCPENGVQQPGRIPYTSSIDLKGDNVTVDFDAAAKAAGFKQSDISIKDGYFELNIPSTAEASVPYGIKIKITSTCGDKDTTMLFQLPIGNDVITQRYNNVLGLLNDSRFDGQTLSDFQWYRKSDSTAIEGQVSSNLNMYDLPEATYRNDEFYICYTINKGQADERYTCACAKGFGDPEKEHEFEANPESLIITAGYDIQEDKVFVNANWGGKKDIECYAQWINASGNVYQDLKFSIPDGGCTIPTPNENGLYLLRVVTDGKSRSFKFIINK